MKKFKKIMTIIVTLSLVLNVLFIPTTTANAATQDIATLLVVHSNMVFAYAATQATGSVSVSLQVTTNGTYTTGTDARSDDGFTSCSIQFGANDNITYAQSYHYGASHYMGATWTPANGYSFFY